MSDPSSYKQRLDKISEPHLEELFELLVSKKLLSTKEMEKPSSSNLLDHQEDEISFLEIMEKLRDLRSVMIAVYSSLSGEQRYLGNIVKYVEYFNEKAIIDVPLGDRKIRSLLENLDNIDQADFSEQWYLAIKEHKLDFTNIILELLNYFSSQMVEKVGLESNYKIINSLPDLNPLTDLMISAMDDESKVVLFDVKYRVTISDLKSLVLRAVEKLGEYEYLSENWNANMVIVVFTKDENHSFNRLQGRFAKNILDVSESFLYHVFFVPVSISNLQEFEPKVRELLNSFSSFEIDFAFTDSPLNHGWSTTTNLSQLSSIFRLQNDEKFGKILNLKLPGELNNYFIEYRLSASQSWSFNLVSLIIKPSSMYRISVELSMKGDTNPYWFHVYEGDQRVEMDPENTNFSYFIFVPFKKLSQDWDVVNIDVRYYLEQTFLKNRLVFDRINGVRLMGELSVAKITFQ
jgi:hypothetical protein